MSLRVLTLRFDPMLEAFDDGPLRSFLADKELLCQRDHFFLHQERPYLAVILGYRLAGERRPAAEAPAKKKRNGWREILDPEDLPLFNTLREWRGQRAREDGIPPYVICTNRQLAEAIRARPESLAALARVEGFGKAKLEKYGAEILAHLEAGRSEPDPGEEADGDG